MEAEEVDFGFWDVARVEQTHDRASSRIIRAVQLHGPGSVDVCIPNQLSEDDWLLPCANVSHQGQVVADVSGSSRVRIHSLALIPLASVPNLSQLTIVIYAHFLVFSDSYPFVV